MSDIKRIAVNTGGGDAPGLNAVIRAVVLSALEKGWEVVGIREGYRGLVDLDYTVKLDVDEQYLLQDVLARARVTAYWRPPSQCLKQDDDGHCVKFTMTERPADSMQLVFFIERK